MRCSLPSDPAPGEVPGKRLSPGGRPASPGRPATALGLMFAIGVILALAPERAVAQGNDPASPVPVFEGARGELGSALDRYVSRYVPFGFSGQILVAKRGRIVLHRAYGMAERATRRRMTTRTAVGIASATKQFTAAAILKLAEDGRLSLDDSIGRWLDDVPADKRSITIDQLLTHTAGVGVGLADNYAADTLDEQVEAILDAPLSQEPGSGWRYSNGGYILAAAIIGRASASSYEEYLRTALFEPAGMDHTGFVDAPPDGVSVARPYTGWEDRAASPESPRNWRSAGTGDMVSTAADLWRWERALERERILSGDWLERYRTVQVRIGDSPGGYAYGLFVHEGRDGRVVEHGGDGRSGYNANLLRYVDRDAVLVVTSNSQLAPGRWFRHVLSPDLAKIVTGRRPDPAAPRARLPEPVEARRMVGTYAVGEGDLLHVVYDGAHLWLAAEGQRATDLLFAGDTDGAALAGANGKTRSLLRALLAGDARDPGAYPRALTEDGLAHLDGYAGEWRRLESSLGPFERFEVLGSVPGRGAVHTTARLGFRDGEVTMRYFWGEGGRGRLRGTHAEVGRGFPIVVLMAPGDGDALVVHDPWRSITREARTTSVGSDLRLIFRGGPEARRRGLAGWTP